MRRLLKTLCVTIVLSAILGCMSMEEMLASDDPVVREVGETRAMQFAIDQDGTADLQTKLDAVGKMRDQNKLAKIYADNATVQEVKMAARAKITEDTAFAAMLVGCKNPAVWSEAMANIKSDKALVAAAAGLLEEGPVRSKRPIAEQLLCRVKGGDAVGEYLSRIVSEGELTETSDLSSKQMCFADRYEIYKIFALYSRPCVAIDALRRNKKVLATKGDIYDFYTPLEVADIRGASDVRKAEILKKRRGHGYMEYLNNGNFYWTFQVTSGAILSSMKDASCLADYIVSCGDEKDIAEAMQYVEDSKTRGVIAVARLEQFAKDGRLSIAAKSEGMPSDESILTTLVADSPVADLKRVATSVSAKVLSSPFSSRAWNHGEIQFSVVRKIASKCNDKTLTSELYARVADCIGRVRAKDPDKWTSDDQSKAVGIMKSWMPLADMGVVKASVEYAAKNAFCGGDYLAAGRSESERATIRQWMSTARLEELSVVENKNADESAKFDAVGRGLYLCDWMEGKTDISTELQFKDAFDGYPICIGTLVEEARRVGGQVVADVGVLNVDVQNCGNVSINLGMLRFKVVADDERCKRIVAQWKVLHRVYVYGVFKLLHSDKYLGEITMIDELDEQTFETLLSDAKKVESIKAAMENQE